MQALCSTDDGVTPGVTVMEEDYKETPTEVGKSPRTKLNCLAMRTFHSGSNNGDLNTYPHNQFRNCGTQAQVQKCSDRNNFSEHQKQTCDGSKFTGVLMLTPPPPQVRNEGVQAPTRKP